MIRRVLNQERLFKTQQVPDLEAVFQGKGCSVARGCWCMCDKAGFKEVTRRKPQRPIVRIKGQ